MKTTTVIKTNVENHVGEFGWWDDDGDTYHSLQSDEAIAELVKRDDFREKFIDGINTYLQCLVEGMRMDLEDIWERLDKIEGKKKEQSR